MRLAQILKQKIKVDLLLEIVSMLERWDVLRKSSNNPFHGVTSDFHPTVL